MSWKVIYWAEKPDRPFGETEIGLLYASKIPNTRLSRHYLDNTAKLRPPLYIILPRYYTDEEGTTLLHGGQSFCIDQAPTAQPEQGWHVECPWPLVDGAFVPLTLTPSINCVGSYHGFVTNGVISDDVEGRPVPLQLPS
jgi:hypothetical protein